MIEIAALKSQREPLQVGTQRFQDTDDDAATLRRRLAGPPRLAVQGRATLQFLVQHPVQQFVGFNLLWLRPFDNLSRPLLGRVRNKL